MVNDLPLLLPLAVKDPAFSAVYSKFKLHNKVCAFLEKDFKRVLMQEDPFQKDVVSHHAVHDIIASRPPSVNVRWLS